MKKVQYITKSLDETKEVAEKLLKKLIPTQDQATVVFFEGDLGAGKTTFTKALAKELGVKDTVISPTFILEKKYAITKSKYYKTLIHIDAYRFEDPKEAKVLGLSEYVSNPQNLIIIEWPSKLGKSIKADVKVSFVSLSETSKKISW
jgi:tRNA threonylcarbamoyladenosine biosynthesis protein TsaE